jgi:hypothetical protein
LFAAKAGGGLSGEQHRDMRLFGDQDRPFGPALIPWLFLREQAEKDLNPRLVAQYSSRAKGRPSRVSPGRDIDSIFDL